MENVVYISIIVRTREGTPGKIVGLCIVTISPYDRYDQFLALAVAFRRRYLIWFSMINFTLGKVAREDPSRL